MHHEYAVENVGTKVGLRNRRAFYLQINGNFEILNQLNVSTGAFIEAASEVMDDVYVSNIIFTICSCFLLAI